MQSCSYYSLVELGNIMILSFIVILKCHDNQNQREIFNIVISPTRYYRKYRDYRKIHCSETFISVKYFQLIFTILVLVALLSDIMIVSIIVIITLMIYRDIKFCYRPSYSLVIHVSCLMLTSPAAHTWTCFCFPTTLTSRLPATKNDALAP